MFPLSEEPKKRSNKACDYCASKKTKCDGNSPCSKCAKLFIECTYSQRPRRKRGGTNSTDVFIDETGAAFPSNNVYNGHSSSQINSRPSTPVRIPSSDTIYEPDTAQDSSLDLVDQMFELAPSKDTVFQSHVQSPNQNLFQTLSASPNDTLFQSLIQPASNDKVFDTSPIQSNGQMFQGHPTPNEQLFQGQPTPSEQMFQGHPTPKEQLFQGQPTPKEQLFHAPPPSSVSSLAPNSPISIKEEGLKPDCSSFPPISYKGRYSNWVHVYFHWVNPKYPLFSEGLFVQIMNDIPPLLLHAMYSLAATVPQPQAISRKAGDFCFNYCKSILDKDLENANPFTVVALFFMAVYAGGSLRSNSSISFLSLAIRLAQKLGIDKGDGILWVSHNGNLMGTQPGTGKDLCQLIWAHLYEYDYYTSLVSNLPTLIREDSIILADQEPANNNICDDLYNPSTFAHNLYYTLIKIARKVQNYNQKEMGNLYLRDEIYSDLINWHGKLPATLKDIPANYTNDIGNREIPSWRMAYVQILYEFLVIQLHLTTFVQAFTEPSNVQPNSSMMICVESASNISKIIKVIYDYNRSFFYIPNFVYLGIHEAGVVHCLTNLIRPSNNNVVEMHIECLRLISRYFGLSSHNPETLNEVRNDPHQLLNAIRTK